MSARKCRASLLFLGKDGDAHVERAAQFCREHFERVVVHLGTWDQELPAAVRSWRGDHIVSYLSRWIVPGELLGRAKTAINFHPGPPDYPGYGCNNFAIYEEAAEYGVTCHHMAPRVDTGAIIAVKRFPVLPTDDAGRLLSRAYDYQLVNFYDIAARLIRGEALPACGEKWGRKPFTRREFAQLGRITADMDEAEIARRVRATTVGRWKPTVELGGFVFELKTDENAP
jgi:methionyl-tRNA formyltransferase